MTPIGDSMRVPGYGLTSSHPRVNFVFDNQPLQGIEGESLSAALLANEIRLIGRSFKFHRPRGIVSIGSEEPNALVTIERPTGSEPNNRATMVRVYAGLTVKSQNHWPSLENDVGALIGYFGPLLPAGFYYKTFMSPSRAWHFYERVIRRMAGLGKVPEQPDSDFSTKIHVHCDLLVAGGGAAGLASALAAGRAGARVILADENPWFGLGLLDENHTIDGIQAYEWAKQTINELASLPNVTVAPNTTVIGRYEDGFVTMIETLRDAPNLTGDRTPRFRFWKVRSKSTIMATGALERPLIFPNNDRPGVMLATAVSGYLNRYGVLAGKRIIIFTNNSIGHRTASAISNTQAEVVSIIDSRPESLGPWERANLTKGIPIRWQSKVFNTRGRKNISGTLVGSIEGQRREWLDCDLLAISGGFSPTISLYAHTGGKAVWNEGRGTFLPGLSENNFTAVGLCNEDQTLYDSLVNGYKAGQLAASNQNYRPDRTWSPTVIGDDLLATFDPITPLIQDSQSNKAFVDFQNDVTAADMSLAVREGYRSIEHVKRYTTLGMGTDQGKLGNVNGIELIANARGEAVQQVGTTRFRPPVVPTSMSAIAGVLDEHLTHPMRRTAAHQLHEEAGAVWVNAGAWLRPQFYRRSGESDVDAVNREVTMVRNNVGLGDVATLGKFEIWGPDSMAFLEKVYMNNFSSLPIGKGRYGVMLREDGMVYDDGVTSRLGEHHFLMNTSTGNTNSVFEWMTQLLETRWNSLRVAIVPVTDQWFAAALVGPNARKVLNRVVEGLDVSNSDFPFMGVRSGKVAGIPARIFRISFSGEISYEINVPTDYGKTLWLSLMEAGKPEQLTPNGVESMGVLRIEKGHFVVGREADGRTNPYDVGLGRMVSTKKWFIGKEALRLPIMSDVSRRQLVGIVPIKTGERLPYSAHLVSASQPTNLAGSQGWITSLTYSPTLGHDIALALLENGRSRIGEELVASAPIAGHSVGVQVVSPQFFDPNGKRQNA